MCDFKPGDEVVCIAKARVRPAPQWMFWTRRVRDGNPFGRRALIVADVSFGTAESFPEIGAIAWIRLSGVEGWFSARSFRKVQRRDLSAWLETATDFEEPKRSPVKEGV